MIYDHSKIISSNSYLFHNFAAIGVYSAMRVMKKALILLNIVNTTTLTFVIPYKLQELSISHSLKSSKMSLRLFFTGSALNFTLSSITYRDILSLFPQN